MNVKELFWQKSFAFLVASPKVKQDILIHSQSIKDDILNAKAY